MFDINEALQLKDNLDLSEYYKRINEGTVYIERSNDCICLSVPYYYEVCLTELVILVDIILYQQYVPTPDELTLLQDIGILDYNSKELCTRCGIQHSSRFFIDYFNEDGVLEFRCINCIPNRICFGNEKSKLIYYKED